MARAFSRSVVSPFVTESAMVCWEKKLIGPILSQGLITFSLPTFSMRIDRLDSQVCS